MGGARGALADRVPGGHDRDGVGGVGRGLVRGLHAPGRAAIAAVLEVKLTGGHLRLRLGGVGVLEAPGHTLELAAAELGPAPTPFVLPEEHHGRKERDREHVVHDDRERGEDAKGADGHDRVERCGEEGRGSGERGVENRLCSVSPRVHNALELRVQAGVHARLLPRVHVHEHVVRAHAKDKKDGEDVELDKVVDLSDDAVEEVGERQRREDLEHGHGAQPQGEGVDGDVEEHKGDRAKDPHQVRVHHAVELEVGPRAHEAHVHVSD
mmetsp:Transcript_24291/g.65865  ORF Transcript_24291/g.65865 Transcript_24291/m.65865 type:complete len:267 (-) Transcript_24291:1130-1930(-)